MARKVVIGPNRGATPQTRPRPSISARLWLVLSAAWVLGLIVTALAINGAACGGAVTTTSLNGMLPDGGVSGAAGGTPTDGVGGGPTTGSPVSTVVNDCSGHSCGTPCVQPHCDARLNDCSNGWCDPQTAAVDGLPVCNVGSPPTCPVPCSFDSDCPALIGQVPAPQCNDPTFGTGYMYKCLQRFCRDVHWPICPEGGDASLYFHYDATATTCAQVVSQIPSLFERARACDLAEAGSRTSCSFQFEAPCCYFHVDDPFAPAVLDYRGRISQAEDMGCMWKTCADSTCPPPVFDHVNCETVSGRPVCVPH